MTVCVWVGVRGDVEGGGEVLRCVSVHAVGIYDVYKISPPSGRLIIYQFRGANVPLKFHSSIVGSGVKATC